MIASDRAWRLPTIGSATRTLAMLLGVSIVAQSCERLPTKPAAAAMDVRGISLVDWSANGYASTSASAALAALSATGANTVVIIVTTYQTSSDASELRADDPRTSTVAAVESIMAAARSAGLRIALKPQIDVDDGSWRARIRPADPAAWFSSYGSFLVEWAAVAESSGVQTLVVGTELEGTLDHEGSWGDLISRVRRAFGGQLTYAASWDEAALVPFWNRLDDVGIDFYYPVASRGDPGRFEVLAAWQPWLDRLERLHRQTDRPIVLTEIGYRSIRGAGMHPSDATTPGVEDSKEQATLYWAALQATSGHAWLKGLWWWDWPTDASGGIGDLGYTPRGKPAADELRESWGGTGAAQANRH